MRILLTGKDGQVGWELQRSLSCLGELGAFARTELDLSKPEEIRRRIEQVRPDVIVNAAAYTAVDKAESEPQAALAVNGVAPGILAEEARRRGVLLVHYSTDYVFDGSGSRPYTEDDTPSPINTYGQSKLAGERAIRASGAQHLILRTSWVYGLRGRNFLLTMRRLCREREVLRVVDDQVGAPTWSRSIADATAQLLALILLSGSERLSAAAVSGTYHLTAAGKTSWCGFTRAIVAAEFAGSTKTPPQVAPISTADYPLPAQRPRNSVLSCDRLRATFGIALPNWDAALAYCMQDQPGGQ